MTYGGMTNVGSMMKNANWVLVQEKGQITLPAELRRKFAIEKGDYVVVEDGGDQITVRRRKPITTEALQEITRILAQEGVTVEDLLASEDQVRRQLAQEWQRTRDDFFTGMADTAQQANMDEDEAGQLVKEAIREVRAKKAP